MLHSKSDLLARFALEQFDGIVNLESFGRFAFDFHNDIAGTHARPVGRSPRKRRHHGQPVGLPIEADLNANPAELLFHFLSEPRQIFLADVRRILIELGQHALDGRFHQLTAIDVFDVVPVDLLERIDEDTHQFIVVVVFLVGSLRRSNEGKHARPDRNHPEPMHRTSRHSFSPQADPF